MRNFYERISDVRILLFSGGVALVCMLLLYSSMGRVLPEGVPGVFSLQTAFSRERLLRIISLWGEDALREYLRLTYLDFLYALAYSLFLLGLIVRLGRVSASRWKYAAGMPLLAGFLDWVENILHLIFLPTFRDLSAGVVFLFSLISALKWGLALFSLAVVLLLFIKYALGRG